MVKDLSSSAISILMVTGDVRPSRRTGWKNPRNSSSMPASTRGSYETRVSIAISFGLYVGCPAPAEGRGNHLQLVVGAHAARLQAPAAAEIQRSLIRVKLRPRRQPPGGSA